MIKNPFEANASKPYERAPDPTARRIEVRRTPKAGSKGDLVQITVSPGVQQFFAELMNHLGKRSDWFATCATCIFWSKSNQICDKFNMRPPGEVIADGCEHYEDEDSIPF